MAVAGAAAAADPAPTDGRTAGVPGPPATVRAVFTVADVRVDVTARTAAAARELALARGHAQAFDRLMRRLVPRTELDRVPRLDAQAIAELVRDFTVDDEKTSPVRYLAKLRVRFKRGPVRNLLRDVGIQFAETRSKPIVVLPVLRRGGVLLLWDETNDWRAGWAALPPADGLVPMVLPEGGLADISDIGPEQAIGRDDERMTAIARRYGASDVLLAVASLRSDPAANVNVVDAEISRLGPAGDAQTVVRSLAAREGETVIALMTRAARAVRAEIEELWKRENLLRFGDRRWLTAVAPLDGLADWVRLRRQLASVAFVQGSDLLALSRGEAVVRLNFIGDEEQLVLALAQRDLSLTRGDRSWTLRVKPSVPDVMTPARNP